MTDTNTLSDRLRGYVVVAEHHFDRTRRTVKRKLGMGAPAIIQPYRGFGDAQSFWLRGRVIEDPGIATAIHSDALWTNIRHTLRRYNSAEIPGAVIEWSCGARSGEVTTDDEGFFDFSFEPGDAYDADKAWQEVHLVLKDAGHYEPYPLGATVRVRTPGPHAEHGVISDIDDTIVYTGATNFLKHWRTVAANSAEGRVSYDHVAELYDALTDNERNPIFYVSSSPWNLFDLFERYMILNGIPLGPMMLKDFGLDQTKWFTGGHDGHKTTMIERILSTYPELGFVLVGDSGQRDLAIYNGIVKKHEGRIKAVIIHDVTDPEPSPEAQVQMQEIQSKGVYGEFTRDYGGTLERLRQHEIVADNA